MTDHTPDSGHAPGMSDAATDETLRKVAPNCNLPKDDASGHLVEVATSLRAIDDACTEAEIAAKDIVALLEAIEPILASVEKTMAAAGMAFSDLPTSLRLLRLASERAEAAEGAASNAFRLAETARHRLRG